MSSSETFSSVKSLQKDKLESEHSLMSIVQPIKDKSISHKYAEPTELKQLSSDSLEESPIKSSTMSEKISVQESPSVEESPT